MPFIQICAQDTPAMTMILLATYVLSVDAPSVELVHGFRKDFWVLR